VPRHSCTDSRAEPALCEISTVACLVAALGVRPLVLTAPAGNLKGVH
jgi:hypothetical protein